MSVVKKIQVQTITPLRANLFIKKHHYSGKVVPNSQVHFGAFLNGQLHGVLQFGPSMDKRKTMAMVEGTGWNEFIELNRMAFDEALPKNSESRVIAICLRTLKAKAPHLKWVVSFADGTMCGDGTIYRASGFLLTGIKKNTGTYVMPDGSTMNQLTASAHHSHEMNGKAGSSWIKDQGGELATGNQLRYIYFLDKTMQDKLTVPILPFAKIDEMGAGMYKGMRRKLSSEAAGFQPAEGGVIPTAAHQLEPEIIQPEKVIAPPVISVTIDT